MAGQANRRFWRRLGRAADRLARGWLAETIPAGRLHRERVAVVVAVRNRSGQRVENFLTSLRCQDVPADLVHITVCDFGSDAAEHEDVRARCLAHQARLIAWDEPSWVWNKSYALNVGIRHSPAEAGWILPTDIDMVFAPDFISTMLRSLLVFPRSMVLCRFRDLCRDAFADGLTVAADFDRLVARSEPVGEHAVGPCLAASRDWYHRVRGFDERMSMWGYMDQDIQVRARRDGLREVWIEHRTHLLHQWHERKFDVHRDDPERQAMMRQRYEANRELFESDQTVVRNDDTWGLLPADAEVVEPAG